MTYSYNFGWYQKPSFGFDHIGRDLISDGFGGTDVKTVDTGHWQAMTDVPHVSSVEMRNVLIEYAIPSYASTLENQLLPNLPWVEEEFEDRVSGEPYNPHPHVEHWPWFDPKWKAVNQGRYSHTYAERYWPKTAGHGTTIKGEVGYIRDTPNYGIHFDYGDLNDVVSLLAKYPGTRQAYLPVWFPEDTGAVHGERVPCSLGYHWLLRDGRLHCNYFIRSCDFLRYLRDDMYLTCRLTQWLCDALAMEWVKLQDDERVENPVNPGDLTMFIGSLHVFEGDMPKMRKLYA